MLINKSRTTLKFLRCRVIWEFFHLTGADLERETLRGCIEKLKHKKFELEKRHEDAQVIKILSYVYFEDHAL